MRGRLAVRINDGLVDRHVPPRKVKNLRFTKTAPGGHAFASMWIGLPRSEFPRLGPNDRVYIYDERTGRTVWEGYTKNPGASDGSSGQGFQLEADGGMVRASDESRALVYIDRLLDQWFRSINNAPASITTTGGDPDDVLTTDGLQLQFPPGSPVAPGYKARMANQSLDAADMTFGAISVKVKSGLVTSGYLNRLYWNDLAGSFGSIDLGAVTSLSDVVYDRFVVDDIPAGTRDVSLSFDRIAAAGNVTVDTNWTFFTEVALLGRRMDRDGNLLSGAAGVGVATFITPDWVVEDLIGRMLTFCDPVTAENDAVSQEIDQFAYHDGATAAAVLEDLTTLYDPELYWGIGETLRNGKHRFWVRRWHGRLATPEYTGYRYQIRTRDDYTATGGDNDLCNRIAIYWTDDTGNKQTTIRGADVPALGDKNPVLASGSIDPTFAGRIKDAEPVTLPDGHGSQTNAEQVGDAILAMKADPPISGTAVVDRQLLDYYTGNMVMPWEIEPGYPVSVQEEGDILRLTEVEYNDDDTAATFTLGEPVRTQDQLIADATRR